MLFCYFGSVLTFDLPLFHTFSYIFIYVCVCMSTGRDPKHQLQLISTLSLPQSDQASELMKLMLIESPRARITAQSALQHAFFTEQSLVVKGTPPPPPMTNTPYLDRESHLDETVLLEMLEKEAAEPM
jgi:serine/threonine protein kinase